MAGAKQAAPAAPAVKTATRSARTVTVACKFPVGVVLQLCRKTTWIEDTPSGSRERIRWDRYGDQVVIRGPARPAGPVPRGYPPPPQMAGGYALTPNVDADFWDQWLDQNAANPIVVNKMIFAHASASSAMAEAREHKASRSGFEPLVPDNDPRVPRPIGPGVTGIETADEMRGRSQVHAEADEGSEA